MFGMSKLRAARPAPRRGSIEQLHEDLGLLVCYAVETKLQSEWIDDALILANKDVDSLSDAEIELMAQLTAKILPPDSEVTMESLRATGSGRNAGKSRTARYLRSLWTLVGMLILLNVAHAMGAWALEMHHGAPGAVLAGQADLLSVLVKMLDVLVPFTYGTIGACVYLMRITGQRLHDRTFDPRRIPGHRNRLVLGTLGGGVITMFMGQTGNLDLSAAAMGFLAGYSVDFLFQTVDRIVTALLPQMSAPAAGQGAGEARRQQVLERFRQRLANTSQAADRRLLEEVIAELAG